MGAWGPAVLSNDTSADVREAFRELVAEGVAAADATQQVLAEFAEDLADEDAAADIWLGLAQAQVQTGRLQESVRDEALRLIDDGSDLRRWRALGAGEATLRKRETSLAKLRAELVGPQRAATKVRLPKRFVTEFEPGDLLAFTYGDRTALLLAASRFKTPGGIWPVVLIAPDVDRTDFTQDELLALPLLSVVYDKAEAWARERSREYFDANPEFRFVREIARVSPADDKVYVAGETTAPEAACLVAVTDLGSAHPDDAPVRVEQVTRVGRWEVPDTVLGVLRNAGWGELAEYITDSVQRGSG